ILDARFMNFNRNETRVQDYEGFTVIWREAQRRRAELLGLRAANEGRLPNRLPAFRSCVSRARNKPFVVLKNVRATRLRFVLARSCTDSPDGANGGSHDVGWHFRGIPTSTF